MSNFVVSARKYRPTTFAEVVGQQSITNTLVHAIRGNQLAQSFLFCGPRGVGKTSCARILAKTINCLSLPENIAPCNTCPSCVAFNESHSFNIHELDAASNNSVDDIRNLVEQVRFAPQIGKYNIYIIDEVHMLSTAAFNAFLKTLEEPPKHAIFILATTEKHKIIPTILSRCQIFDFKRISIEDIVGHLVAVAQKENIQAEIDALHIIAQKSDGSLRDSLSIFDRLASHSNQITYQHVIENLNVLDHDYFFKITSAILTHDYANTLLIFNNILQNGFDGHHFINGLSAHFRDLLVSKDRQTLVLLEKGESLKERYLSQSKQCSQEFLLLALDICSKCDVQYRMSQNQQLLVEFNLLKLCSGEDQDTKKKIISQAEDNSASPKKENKTIPLASTASPVSAIIPTKNTAITPSVKHKPTTSQSLGMISIANIGISEQEAIQEEIQPVEQEEFSVQDLQKVWQDFIAIQKEKLKTNLATTLEMFPPVLSENFQIEVQILNKSQEELIKQEKQEILAFLRKELKNDSVDIFTAIQATDNSERNPYTNKDKLQQMSQDNPNIKRLVQELGLEYDF